MFLFGNLVLVINKGFHMQTQNDLIFRRKNNGIVIKRDDGQALFFPNSKKAWHSKQNGEDTIVVVTAMGSKTRVNKSLSKEC